MQQPALVLGITSDLLCPTHEQKKLAAGIPGASYVEIDSMYGHDGFLVEAGQISKYLENWMGKIYGRPV